jgi:hypothetical protein
MSLIVMLAEKLAEIIQNSARKIICYMNIPTENISHFQSEKEKFLTVCPLFTQS